MVWGRPEFEMAESEAARHCRGRNPVRCEVFRTAALAVASVPVPVVLEAVAVETF